MTRDETIELWQECEKARAAAFASGRGEDQAHEAAKDIWNHWALTKGQTALQPIDFNYVIFLPKGYGPATRDEAFNDGLYVHLQCESVSHKFDGYMFPGPASFLDSQFIHEAVFSRCQFCDNAFFGGTRFLGPARFDRAVFGSNSSFLLADFGALATFKETEFRCDTDFSSAMCKRHFDLNGARFHQVPNFSQVDFKQAPDLDGASLPHPPFLFGGAKDLVPRYRALKRLAIQAHDYEREQMSFKGELRSRRWVIDRWFGPSVWLGVLYDGLSDCGRSFWRPFLLWALMLAAFSLLYLEQTGFGLSSWVDACNPALAAPKWLKALGLSISNSIPVIGATRADEVRAIYSCLYPPPPSAQGSPILATIPPWLPIIEVLQSILSAILIFLFLLGIRNQFKIK